MVHGQPGRVGVVRLGLAGLVGVGANGVVRVAVDAFAHFFLPHFLYGGDVLVANPAFAISGGGAVAVKHAPDFFEGGGKADAVEVFADTDVVRVGGRVVRQRRVGFLQGEVFVEQGGEADGVAVGGDGVRVAVKPQCEAVVQVEDVAVFGFGVDLGVDDLAAGALGFGVVVDAVEAFVVRHEGYPEGVVEGVFRQSCGVNVRQAHLRPVFAVIVFAKFAPFLLFAVDFVQPQPARFARRDAVVDLAVEGAVDGGKAVGQAHAVFAFKVFQFGVARAGVERAGEATGSEVFEVVFEFFGNVHVFGCAGLSYGRHCTGFSGRRRVECRCFCNGGFYVCCCRECPPVLVSGVF